MEAVVASAPGRVNLIGEHLDYNGGRCLPMALPQRTTATVRRSGDDRISVRSGELTWSGAVGERAEGWAAYVVGVLDVLGITVPLDVEISSDVPSGSGLSSSAALECSVATAVDALLVLGTSRSELAAACIRAESEYVGAPTGGLDQTVVMHGEDGAALLVDFADGSRSRVPFDPEAAGLAVLVIDTRVEHRLVDGGYAARRADCEDAAAILGVGKLCEVTGQAAALASLADPRLRRRVRHVLSEQQRVTEFVAALGLGDWAEAGALMTSSHESLRDDFQVSCDELDAAVGASLDAGALGARMTGGGFGGSAIALVPTELVPDARRAVDAAFTSNGWGAPAYLDGHASTGARVESG